jgi:hypothetical protein
MLIPNHPDDERLSALASSDPEAAADPVLTEHLATCIRCTDTVAELGALRASLAELPDLQPNRPLRLLPPVDEPAPSRTDAVGGWARRFFAPMLTAGAALALVGLVGTTVPILGSASSGAAAPSDALEQAETDSNAGRGAYEPAAGGPAASLGTDPLAAAEGGSETSEPTPAAAPVESDREVAAADQSGHETTPLDLDERSIFPMLLFAGVAILIAAALLRWILAPRAG